VNKGILILYLLFSFKTNFSKAQSSSNTKLENIFKVYQINTQMSNSPQKELKLGFYKKHISKQISANCEFNSSCSQFMKEGISHFGFFKGFLLGIDRVSRCGASQNTYVDLSSLFDKKEHLLIDDLNSYE